MVIPELWDDLIGKGLADIDEQSEADQHLGANNCANTLFFLILNNPDDPYVLFQALLICLRRICSCADVPALPQAASSSTRRFIQKKKERQEHFSDLA